MQEQLVSLALKLRREETDEHILVYDECAAPGNQEQSPNLLEDITNGLVSSIIVERPDRLFRSEHARTMHVLQKQQITVIVPGKRVYDFCKEEDVQAFQMDIQDAYEYIAAHIRYMHATRSHQKRGRSHPLTS